MNSTMIDFDKGWDAIKDQKDTLIATIRGDMTYFPLCCSTGILKNVTAQRPTDAQENVFKGKLDYTYPLPEEKNIKEAKAIYELIRLVQSNPYFLFPDEVGRWYCMSLILRKTETGKDDSGNGAYGNYKCAQVTMFDRLLEDKDPKKGFNFHYNMIFSVDQFQEWLASTGDEFGEVYLSPAVPGAHKARVRGCVFTPKLSALQNYEKERLETLRQHILANYEFLKAKQSTKNTKDPIARTW